MKSISLHFCGENILSFISTWLRFSYTCHKGCLNTWLGDRKLREAKLRCFFKASKTVASPGRWLMWCTAKTLRCSIPSRLTLERPTSSHVFAYDPTSTRPGKLEKWPKPLRQKIPETGTWYFLCKCKERHHPHPTPQPTRIHDLRSIDHVCKCKERYHPTPPQPHPIPWLA